MSPLAAQPLPTTRRYDLDWLRVLAFGLLIFYHTGMVFVGWDFHLMSKPSTPVLELPMEFLNQWRMPLLFVISGVGLTFALARRTAGQLVGERLQRLLLPLVFGMVVVVVPQVYYERLAQGAGYTSLLDFYPHYFEGTYPKGNFTWNHLWFIAYLLPFSLLSLPIALQLRRPRAQALLARLSAWLQRPGRVLLLALPLVVWQLVLRPYWPDHRNLISDWFNFTYYLTLFSYGYLLGPLAGFWLAAERQRYLLLVVGLAAFCFYYWGDDYILRPRRRGHQAGGAGLELLVLGARLHWVWPALPQPQLAPVATCQRGRVPVLHPAPDRTHRVGLLCVAVARHSGRQVSAHCPWHLRRYAAPVQHHLALFCATHLVWLEASLGAGRRAHRPLAGRQWARATEHVQQAIQRLSPELFGSPLGRHRFARYLRGLNHLFSWPRPNNLRS